MRDLHRVKFTGKGGDRKIPYLQRSYVCELLELYFQGGKPLLCYGTLHTAKTTFCSTG